jgi:hypothetical protein
MHHSFDISIAETYGVNIAIFLNNMYFWIKKNQANNKHFHDGRYWTYNTIEAYTILFPYWSFKQMRTILKNLKEKGLLLSGNYNATNYDRTQWYALTDKAHEILSLPICPKRQIKMAKSANQTGQSGTPIPDIKPDIKPDKNKERERKRSPSPTNVPSSFNPNEGHELLATQLNLDLNREKDSFIDYYKGNGEKRVHWNSVFNNWLRKAPYFNKESSAKEHSVTKVIRELKENAQSKEFKHFLN